MRQSVLTRQAVYFMNIEVEAAFIRILSARSADIKEESIYAF